MPCYHPIDAFRARAGGITFSRKDAYLDLPLTIPCQQCIGCRLEHSRQWALRCVHEASLHDENCFITLTYNDTNLPDNNSLKLRHFQLFMKRLRKKYGSQIRFYHCGEYGDLNNRPHYHAVLFNHDFTDKIHYQTVRGNRYYISDALSTLWPFGFSVLGDVTFESAAYVARYCVKKRTGRDNKRTGINWVTGEILEILPEYSTMSRRPGIGLGWYKKFKSDIYPSDFIVENGVRMKPPKYYDRLLELDNEREIQKYKGARIRAAAKHSHDQTPERLAERETVKQSQAIRLKRG